VQTKTNQLHIQSPYFLFNMNLNCKIISLRRGVTFSKAQTYSKIIFEKVKKTHCNEWKLNGNYVKYIFIYFVLFFCFLCVKS